MSGETLDRQWDMKAGNSGNPQQLYYTYAFFAFLVVISLQNILVMAFAKHSTPIAMAIFVTKELYIAIVMCLVAITVLMTGRVKKELIIPLGMITYLLINSVVASPYFNLVSLRQALIIPVFLVFGFYFARRTHIGKLSKWVFNLYLLIVLLGLFERFFLYTEDEMFFKALGVQEWSAIKGWGYGIPAYWYSGDLAPWIGRTVRRMPGLLLGDAVNFGQAMAFPFILAIIFRRYVVAGIVFVALIFSLSKGGILAAFVGIGLYVSFERFSKGQRYIFLLFCGALLTGLVYISLDLIMQVGSLMNHFKGWYENTLNLLDNPFGGGVGSGGNFARRFNLTETSDAFGLSTGRLSDVSGLGYGESYFGVMLAQFGVVGLMMYLYYPLRLLRTRVAQEHKFLQAVKYTGLGLFAVGVFAESAFSYIGTGFVVALIPFVLNANMKGRRRAALQLSSE